MCLFQKFSLRRETIDCKEKWSTIKEFAKITAHGPGMSGVLFDLLVDYEKKHKENVVLMAQLVCLQSMTSDNDDDEPQPEMFCH